MITDEHLQELEVKGYTVVTNVINKQECDRAIREYQTWLRNFGEKFPKSYNSIVNDYNIGHQETTWRLRLLAKPVFQQLWKTDKLLTSFDAVAIGRPPEDGVEDFEFPGKYWLHSDFTASRRGLHAYQGALYLEEQTKNDWTFQVMEGSHKYMNALWDGDLDKAEQSVKTGFYYRLGEGDEEYFKKLKCRLIRVPVPKGGMALWDSRLVHANARPLQKRKTAGRWRYVTFISMTPAIWANDVDLEKHREAYQKPAMTTHWSSQGLRLLNSAAAPGIPCPTAVPDIARTEDAMKLSGMLPYDFNDGKSNGDAHRPEWTRLHHRLPEDLDLEKQYANGHI